MSPGVVRKPLVTPPGKIRKVQASKLQVSVIWKKILARNATLSMLLMVQRTILYGGGGVGRTPISMTPKSDLEESFQMRRIRIVISQLIYCLDFHFYSYAKDMNRIKCQISPRVPSVNKKQNNTKLSLREDCIKSTGHSLSQILSCTVCVYSIVAIMLSHTHTHSVYICIHTHSATQNQHLRFEEILKSYFRSLSSISKFLSY